MMVILSLLQTLSLHYSLKLSYKLSMLVDSKQRRLFHQLVLKKGLMLIVASAFFNSLFQYCQDGLEIEWRENLTKYVHEKYFTGMNYYSLVGLDSGKSSGIVDPEHRIARDISSVTQRLVRLVASFIQSCPPLVWFTYQIYKILGSRMAALPHICLLISYEIAQSLFPKNIGELYRAHSAAEGAYFKSVARVQSYAESIVALGGTAVEKSIVKDKFSSVHSCVVGLNKALFKFGFVFKSTYVLAYKTVALPVFIDYVMRGAVTNKFVYLMHSLRLVAEAAIANGQLLTLHALSDHMRPLCGRVTGLIDALGKLSESHQSQKLENFVEGDEVRFENVDVITPTGNVLVRELSFTVKRESNLLLTGANGAGKSSIFRCLGGLWHVSTGRITKPGVSHSGLHNEIFYLPQKPYNVIGTLRDQIVYPYSEDQVSLNNEQIGELLEMVSLSYLNDKDACKIINWEDRLSLGEQQRLAMARLFYHSPRFAILDECTSAVNKEMEELLYMECRRLKIAYITICHRPALKRFHDHSLHLLGNSQYVSSSIPHEDAKIAEAQSDLKTHRALSEHQGAEQRSLRYAFLQNMKPIPKRSAFSKLRFLGEIMVGKSFAVLSGLFGLILLRTITHETFSYFFGQMIASLTQSNRKKFAWLVTLNIPSELFNAWVEESVSDTQKKIALNWNENLVSYALEKYFNGNVFYSAKNVDKRIEDPQNRITNELKELSSSFAEICSQLFNPAFDFIWFSLRLYYTVGIKGLGKLYLYLGALFLAGRALRPKDHKFIAQEKEVESSFSFIHSRLRNHAESVAFSGGGSREHAIANQKLEELSRRSFSVKRVHAVQQFITQCCSRDYSSVSDSLSLPLIMTWDLQLEYLLNRGDAALESLMQAKVLVKNFAFKVASGFGDLSNIQEHLSNLLSTSSRVCEMFDILDELYHSQAGQSASIQYSDDAIELRNVDIVTPVGRCLAADVSMRSDSHHSIMVTGHNGTGKTSFFRVISGLWPFYGDSAVLVRPANMRDVLLVPQRTYCVTGNLAAQISYPQVFQEITSDLETRLRSALEVVGIRYLVDRENGNWNVSCNWENTLSLGEQQKIGIARIFFHMPKFAVLDECTDAVSADVERELYTALHKAGVKCITISKRLNLVDFHKYELRFGVPNDCGWSLSEIQ